MRRPRPRWFGWARRSCALGFLVLLVLGGRFGLEWVRGSSTATTMLSALRFADPLAALEVSLATRQFDGSLLLGALLVVLVTLLLGPVFCSWLCPLGLALDLNQGLRRRLRRRVPLGPTPGGQQAGGAGWKFLLLGMVLGFSLVASLPLFQLVSPINIIVWALVFGVGPALLLVLALALLEWWRPRIWCRSFCPLGALHGLLGRRALFRIRIDSHRAGRTPCHQCTLHCPMGIQVMEEYSLAGRTSVDHPDCTRCGSCIDACPSGVLKLGFRDFPRDDSHPERECPTARPTERGEPREQPAVCASGGDSSVP